MFALYYANFAIIPQIIKNLLVSQTKKFIQTANEKVHFMKNIC